MFRIMTKFDSHYLQIWILNFLHAFFLSIEIFWNDQYFSYVLRQKFINLCIRMLYLWNLKNRCDRDFRIRKRFEKSFWSWFSHLLLFFSIFSQFALKIWKSFSWMIQKKHDLMTQLFAVFNIENLISYNLRISIWWLITNWMTMKFEFESIYICLFFIFLFYISKSMNWSRKKCLNAKNVVIAIALNIKFRNFLDFLYSFHFAFTFMIFNVRLNRITISENVFDTIQLFMRREFQTINSTKLWHEIWNDYFRINCFIKKIIFAKRWTRHDIECQIVRINCIIKKIEFVMLLIFRYVFVIWFDLNLLHDLFVIIKRLSCRDIDITISVNWFVKWIIFAKNVRHRTRHDIRLFSNQLYHQKDYIVVLLIFKYFFAIRFVRDSIVYLWL